MTTFNIIANAKPLTPALIHRLKSLINKVALDGIAADCLAQGMIPDFVCGDFDSVQRQTLEKLRTLHSIVKYYPDQNYSDLDKGIFWCDEMGASCIHIFNALGGLRPDHTFFNYRILKRHYKPSRMLILEEPETTLYYIVDQTVLLEGKVGDLASILAYPECTVSSAGLRYNMQDYPLVFSKTESSSNELALSTSHLIVKGDALLIVAKNVRVTISGS